MALTKNVTKVSVSEAMDGMWNITLNLTCLDSAVEVINQNISFKYKIGQDIDDKQAEALESMQEIIDDYLAEQVIFDHAKLDNLVTYLESNLTG